MVHDVLALSRNTMMHGDLLVSSEVHKLVILHVNVCDLSRGRWSSVSHSSKEPKKGKSLLPEHSVKDLNVQTSRFQMLEYVLLNESNATSRQMSE